MDMKKIKSITQLWTIQSIVPQFAWKSEEKTWTVNSLAVIWKTYILNISHVTGANLLVMRHCVRVQMDMSMWERVGVEGGEIRKEEKTAALHNRAWMNVKVKMEKNLRTLYATWAD